MRNLCERVPPPACGMSVLGRAGSVFVVVVMDFVVGVMDWGQGRFGRGPVPGCR